MVNSSNTTGFMFECVINSKDPGLLRKENLDCPHLQIICFCDVPCVVH